MDEKRPEATTKPREASPRIQEIKIAIDERDETIRQLNEALSRALDELNAAREAA
jgi:hypothetical protein